MEKLKTFIKVSIPQAVSTVATAEDKTSNNILKICAVSIPQAVSTVATKENKIHITLHKVSIPQAVSTVATAAPRNPVFTGLKIRF